MPLLNNKNSGTTAFPLSNRATEMQLGPLQRDVHANRRSSLRSTDISLLNSRQSPSAVSGDTVNLLSNSVSVGTSRTRSAAVREMLQPECGNPACPGRWTPPWRSRSRPFFEGKWACSQRCLLAIVTMSVAREIGDGVPDTVGSGEVQHRHRVPLGLVMLAQGWITHSQLRKALEMQKLKGTGRIGDWLVSECGLRAEWVTRGLSVQWNCPVLTTESFSPEEMARVMPRPFIEEYGILPVRVAGRKILYVGFQDHIDASSAFAVEQISGLRTECGVIGEERYRKARELVLDCQFLDMKQSVVGDRDSLARSIERVIDRGKPTSARLVRLHKYYWLRLWHENDMSLRSIRQIPVADEAADFLFTIES
jgi:hypothetical protein